MNIFTDLIYFEAVNLLDQLDNTFALSRVGEYNLSKAQYDICHSWYTLIQNTNYLKVALILLICFYIQTCSEGHTVGHSGHCPICEQDQEFQESLATDRARRLQREGIVVEREQQARVSRAQQEAVARVSTYFF